MKKLIIISTKVEVGAGGISTALVGYINGLKRKGIDFEIIESHEQGKNTLFTWFKAFFSIISLTIKYKQNAVFWFHCGPWLSTFRKCSLAIVPRLMGCKTIGHIHSPTFYQYLSKKGFSAYYIKACLTPFSTLCMLTPWWDNLLGTFSINKKSFISPNPNNDEYCDIAKQYLILPKKNKSSKFVKLLSMSRLVDGKGVDVVIKSMVNLSENYSLTIAGDGPLKEKYQGLVHELNLKHRVKFTGWVNGDEKKQLLHNADIFCLPSSYDSFGMVFIEAMAFNLPVIAYGWGPIPDVVTPDVGICCKNSNVDDVVSAIKYISQNFELYNNKGPEKVLTKYTPEKVIENFLNQIY